MDKKERHSAAKEWNKILKEHPRFARVFLAQQVVLMEASELGSRLINDRMCRLLDMGLPVPFRDFWVSRCQRLPIDLEGIWQCISTARNPEDCFGINHEDEWFNDPLKNGQTLPARAPIPPLRF